MTILNPSIKHHAIIGALIGAWGFLFAFFARPFEHGTMDLEKWIYVSLGFSFLAFLSYLAISFFQKYVFEKKNKWNITLEISTYLLFYLLYTLSSFIYYKSPIIEGFYDFPEFLVKIIVNRGLIITPLILIARRYSIQLIPMVEDFITIKGENKLDILKIKRSELVCISNSQNYVEIFFLENDTLRSKLIRSSLKKMQADFKFLLQVHRSHLINPIHFKSWKNASVISLTQIELPVSKNYKSQLLSL